MKRLTNRCMPVPYHACLSFPLLEEKKIHIKCLIESRFNILVCCNLVN